jgi:hypothetical protein
MVIKICITCLTIKTSKWYSGPLCRQCFRKQPHVKEKELASSRISCANYRKEHKEELTSKNKSWVEANKDVVQVYQKEYRANNKERKRELERGYWENDVNHRLGLNLRNRFNQALKKNFKCSSAVKDLGCSIEELKLHLESKFKPGMTWDNHTTDGWHIDHIRPLASFDLSDPEQQKLACHYSNLQPLWAYDNLSKGDTYAE